MKQFHYRRFPGDTIVVPMIIGVILNSFVPSLLQIGSFWTSIVHGTGALVGIFLFFLGASMNINSAGMAVKKGVVIIVTKIAMSIVLGFAVAFLCHDSFLGLSSLAIIGGISVANNALYSGIVATMGDDSDKGAVGITSLSVGPTVTMIALSSAGLASVSIGAIVGSILPLLLGIAIGAVCPALKKILSAGVTPSIIVVGFALGANMSISQLFQGGISGILLGVITTIVVGSITVLMEKLTCHEGVAAAAISSTAASAVANPQALADVDAKYAAICPIATAQIAASVIVTAFLTPWFTAQIAKRSVTKETASTEPVKL